MNGKTLAPAFQWKIGYAEQMDIHEQTATVREALRFAATLRQPDSVSRTSKYRYVEEIIDLLDLRDLSSAIVGRPGAGLNIEQRKRL